MRMHTGSERQIGQLWIRVVRESVSILVEVGFYQSSLVDWAMPDVYVRQLAEV